MDLETIMLSEISQRKMNIMQYHLYVESKKKKKDVLFIIWDWNAKVGSQEIYPE